MSHPHPAGLLAAYNSLTDKHLAGYFNNTRIRRHLLRSGLITRNGRVLSEKEYKVNIMKQEHQKYIRECLAQAIFHKVLDIERNRQMEIKRKLESSAKKERIQRLKGEHTRRFVESNIPILSPHPPPGPKTNRGHSVLVDQGDPSPLTLTAPRPYTAPGNMQPPIRLQPLLSNYSARNASKFTPGPRSKTSFLEKEAPFPIGGKKAMMKFRNSLNNSQRVSTYHLPDINRYTMPAPPPLPPSGKVPQEHKSEPWRRRRRLRPITAPNGLEPLFTRDSGRIHKTSLHSNAVITMVYLGKNVHLSHDDRSFQDEIKVYQQHCGGENLCVYKGKLLEKDTFQFISKRHHGFPFSLTFFLNGMQVNRLSSCCEFKHRRSSRLGGKGGYFGFVCVEKASPCYRCIIAMGLDRKASSVKPRRDKSTEKREELRKGQGKPRKNRENLKSRTKEIKGDESSVSAMFSAQELMGVREVRTAMEEMELKRKPSQDVWEEDQENTFKYDYEEDFEVEEEKQDDKANEDRQAYDQMNRISKSPTGSEKDNLVLKKEREISPQKTPDAEDLEDEDIGCLDSDGEEDKQDIKTASSISSRSYPYSSESDDESSERDRKAYTGSSTNQSTGSSPSLERNEGDKPGKRRLPADDSLQTEMKKEVTKADVKDRPLLTEEEMEKGAWEIVEDGSEKLREPASQEAKDEPERWEGSPGQEYDRKAGVLGVEEGVGQILSEALAPGFHSDSDITSGTRHSEEVSEPMRKLEMDSSGAPSWNYVVEKRAALTSEEKSKNVVREIHTLEKKVLTEDAAPRPGDARTAGGELKEKAGATKVPLEERRETAKREALAAQTSEGRRRPGDSVTLRGDTGEPALVSTGLEAREAVSAGKQGLEKTWLADRPTLSPQPLQRRKAVDPETPETKSGGAEGAAGPPTPVVGDKSGEKTPTGPEDPGPGQDPGREGEAGACGLEGWASSTPEEGAAREGTVTLGESDREDDRAEMSPEAFNAARERGKAKRAQTPPNDAGPETGEGTRAKALRGGDAVQSNQGHEEEPAKEIKSEEETRASPNEREPDADRAQPRGATDLKKDGTGLLEDSLRDGTVTLFEAAPPCEESLEKAVAGQPAHKAWAELPGQNLTSPQPGMEESYHDPQGSGGTAGREPPSDKAHTPEGTAPAPGQGEEGARQELEGLAGLQRKDGESPLQAAPIPRPSLEEAPEGDPTLPGNCRGAEEEGRTQGTSEMEDSLAEGDRASGGGEGGPAGTEEGLHGGLAVTASERREKWALCSQVAEGHTVASKASFSGVAAEGMWQEAGQPPAEGRVEVALSPGEARLGTPRKDPEGQASRLGQGQGQEGGMGTCREDGAAEEEGGQGPSSHNAPELSKEPLQAAAPLPEKPDFSGTCEAEDAQGRKLLS